MEYKQAVVLRTDIEMSRGKDVAQACHASLGAYRRAEESMVEEWISQGQKKVVLEVEGLEKLMDLYKRAQREGFPSFIVKDAGETELEPGTKTCIGIGPAPDSNLDKITGELSPV
ncbi:MAG: peptidyl-tRNA hydrolase Pth2 [Candidatus Nanohaloarchaeota archaeon QJJ-9]|nr:peptidyl-tRNA hydrolase Pth2 [Candidatus Nanohaloarchaeota archaeon QJJ-9]